MERKPNYILLLLAMLSICSLLGFARSYLFPLADFQLISIAIHLHFLIFITWTSLIFIPDYALDSLVQSMHKSSIAVVSLHALGIEMERGCLASDECEYHSASACALN
ncbi:MAG TPA: hypothetical protein VKZ76_09495 [Edaphocola sp.]|nr:hypothetical protein [Edaphocola sp.]